jgi:hypothetical protein
MGIAMLTFLGIGATQAATSVKLKDVIASQTGQGTINLFNTQNPKDVVTGATLEACNRSDPFCTASAAVPQFCRIMRPLTEEPDQPCRT